LHSIVSRRSAGLLIGVLSLALSSGCGLLSAPSVPNEPTASASPTLLPAPKPFSSPEAGGAPLTQASPSPRAVAAEPTVPPTRIPPPNLNPGAPPNPDGPHATVVNTDGQGANMRAEPSPSGTLVRTITEGTELEVIGDEREVGGRTWRNVRDPASGSSGWIVSELLEVSAAPAQAAPAEPASPAAVAKPGASGSPPPAAKPAGEPKPGGEPKPSGSPSASGGQGIAAQPLQRIGDDDRAYLSTLQPQIDALGKGIAAANEQIERTGGRPDTVNDPGWQKDTRAVADSLKDAAAQIRAANPGPSTGEVHRFARNAADRADEAANGLTSTIDNKDARALNGVRTTLVRLLAEINNMNLTLLNLQ
jgi:hypothetical protein